MPRPEAYSGHAGNPVEASAGWEDYSELNELEVAERLRVQIHEFIEVSRHIGLYTRGEYMASMRPDDADNWWGIWVDL